MLVGHSWGEGGPEGVQGADVTPGGEGEHRGDWGSVCQVGCSLGMPGVLESVLVEVCMVGKQQLSVWRWLLEEGPLEEYCWRPS